MFQVRSVMASIQIWKFVFISQWIFGTRKLGIPVEMFI
jgi:hypothetical protein